MNIPLPERPAETARPARRSLAELAAMLASDAVVEKLPSRQLVASKQSERTETSSELTGVNAPQRRQGMINGQIHEAPDAATTHVLPTVSRNRPRPDEDRTSQQLDEVTLAAARSARFYRSSMLEDLKIHTLPAAKVRNRDASAVPAPQPAEQLREREKRSDPQKRERPVPQTADRAEDSCVRNYRAKACELIDADLNASLKYVRLLANARSPAELIELSANHARAHFELVIKHAAALVALSRSMMGGKD